MASDNSILPGELTRAISAKKFEATKLHFTVKTKIRYLTIDYAGLPHPWYRKLLFTYRDVVCEIYLPRHNYEDLPVCQVKIRLVKPVDQSECEIGVLIHTLKQLQEI